MFAPAVPLDPGIYQFFLTKETGRSVRYSHFFSVCNLRIDQDGADGDSMVRAVAEIVRETVRDTDLIGFTNGSTLSVLLLNTEIHTAFHIAERIRTRVGEQTFSNSPLPIKVTTSLGAACFPTHGSDAVTLMGRADEMLAMARSNGGNRTIIPSP